jgi:hypothetical protein
LFVKKYTAWANVSPTPALSIGKVRKGFRLLARRGEGDPGTRAQLKPATADATRNAWDIARIHAGGEAEGDVRLQRFATPCADTRVRKSLRTYRGLRKDRWAG